MALGGGLGRLPIPDRLKQEQLAGISKKAEDGALVFRGGGFTATAPTARELAAKAAADAAAAQAAAEARARTAANSAARERATGDLARLNAEITANRAKKLTNQQSLDALARLVGGGEGSHAAVRDNALEAINQALTTKLAKITESFDESLSDFTDNLRDNEQSEADSSFANFANRAREKQDVVTQALSQGAGESDILRSQLQALRNWASNQGDVNRSFFDTRASINAGITDLNRSTKTGMMNEELSSNAARGGRWDDYYDQQASTYTDMANLDQNNYLLQAEIDATEAQKANPMSLLAWLDAGKDSREWQASTPKTTAAAAPPAYDSPYADLASRMAGSFWTDPGVSQSTQDWEGGAQSEGSLNTTRLWNAQDNTNVDGSRRRKRPEGATLRRW